MAFLAFQTANIFHKYFVHLRFRLGNLFLVELDVFLVVLFVEWVVCKFNLCLFVATDTPAHTEGRILVHDIHFLDWTVAFLALDLTNRNVLCMVKIGVVWEVVDTGPFDWSLYFTICIIAEGLHNTVPLAFYETFTRFIQGCKAVGGHVLLSDPFFVQVLDLLFAPRIVIGYVAIGHRVVANGGKNFGNFLGAGDGTFFDGCVAVHASIGSRDRRMF